MKKNNIYLIVILLVVILLIWEQSKLHSNIWIQIVGIVIFFYGMSRLSAKTPSKNNENKD